MGNRKPVESKWVFTIKDDDWYKARLVAKGCSQKPGLDYHDSFAPVANMNSIRVMLSLANEHKLIIHQMDVKTAYLNGELNEEVFMELPADEFGKSKIVKLQKSLYGLKQSGRSWNDGTMRKLGFFPLSNECCIYKMGQHQLYVVLYVDDVLIIGSSAKAISWIKNKL